MNKNQILALFIEQLENKHRVALASTQSAIAAATDEETVPENKYDTLALEAAYLAHGQAMRAQECEQEIQAAKRIVLNNDCEYVRVGSLVSLIAESGELKWLFISPCSGGLTINYQQQIISVITFQSPLGTALKNKQIGDDVSYKIGTTEFYYEVDSIE